MSGKRKGQCLISDLFKKKTKEDDSSNVLSKPSVSSLQSESLPPSGLVSRPTVSEVKPIEVTPVNHGKSFSPYDIGLFLHKPVPDEEKITVLQNFWQPSITYQFPVLEKFQKRKLKFQFLWFNEFPWLVYSEKEEGAFCKYCFLFAKHGAGVNSQELGSLVKHKFTNWKKAKEIFRNHSCTDYHNNSVIDFKNLKKTLENKSVMIVNQLDSARHAAVMKNRHNLKPVIETIVLCGRQELALRGHRDSGNIETTFKCADKNAGNFRALLRYRSRGDKELQEMLDGSGKIKYLSPLLQNEIISSCNSVMKSKLVKEINDAQYFSILVDETCDISNIEQMSLCVRYVVFENGSHCVKEHFLQFEPVSDLTGKGLASTILSSLESYGINLNGLRGQGYDGAANMSGKYNGVSKIVQDQHPLAVYVHCAAHSLNLAVSRACEVQEVRNCLGTIEKCYTFFNTPKRQEVLNDAIEKSELDPRIKTLKRLCATRWVAKFNAVRDFMHIFDFVVEALDTISSWKDKDGCESINLKWALLNTEFCVAVHVIANVFAFGIPLCKELQKENLDLKEAVSLADICQSELQLMRKNAEKEFHEMFTQVKAVASDNGIDLKIPRTCKIQKNRSNAPCTSQDNADVSVGLLDRIEQHFRINLFVPFLEFFISQLEERFKKHKSIFEGFQCLFSSELTNNCKIKLEALVQFYATDVYSISDDIFVELKVWRKEVERTGNKEVLKSAITSLDSCDPTLYPSIYHLLKILCTLPVTTCTPERSFSTLKRIKTYLRNSTGQVSVEILSLNYYMNFYFIHLFMLLLREKGMLQSKIIVFCYISCKRSNLL